MSSPVSDQEKIAMALGVSAAVLAVAALFVTPYFVPWYGLTVSVVACLVATVGALYGERICCIIVPILSFANLLAFLVSPAFVVIRLFVPWWPAVLFVLMFFYILPFFGRYMRTSMMDPGPPDRPYYPGSIRRKTRAVLPPTVGKTHAYTAPVARLTDHRTAYQGSAQATRA